MSSTTPGSEPERRPDADGADRDADLGAENEPAATSEPVEPAATSEPVEPVEPVVVDASEPETPDTTARLDEAVERANAMPMESESAVAAMAADASFTAEPAPEPEPVYVAPPGPQTIYVQAPTPPRARGNRGFGALVALVGTALFALIYAGVAFLLVWGFGTGRDNGVGVFTEFLTQPVYWIPIVAFFVGFAVLAAIVNRGPWWAYAVFGLLVAVFVYFSYLGAALLTVQAWTLTADEAATFVSQRWLDPFAVAAFVIANQIPIWLGGWIAAHGRIVTERNRLAREAYDRELAAGPQPQRL
jgi:hypothetical protein